MKVLVVVVVVVVVAAHSLVLALLLLMIVVEARLPVETAVVAVSVAADRTVLPVVVEVATVAASAASVEWVVMTLDGLLFLSLSL